MICKNCSTQNDPRANFCAGCGEALYDGTVVTYPAARQRITATHAPTSGIRVFSGMGNGYLHSAAMNAVHAVETIPRSDAYHPNPTNARAYLRKNGTWICPDCGELNGHEKLWCTGCGRYR